MFEDLSHLETRAEDLKVLQDIANFSLQGKRQSHGSLSLPSVIAKARLLTSERMLFHVPTEVIQETIHKGRVLYSSGRIEEAFRLWTQALKVDPANPTLHSLLQGITSQEGEQQERALSSLRKCHFRWESSFGRGCIKAAFDMLFSEKTGVLWVTDFGANKILLFGADGRLLEELRPGLNGPAGMFEDHEHRIWVCDFNNARVLAFDADLRALEQIPLAGRGSFSPFVHPRFGCCVDQKLILLVTDNACVGRKIVTIDLPSMAMNTLDGVPSHLTPVCLEVDRDKIFFGGVEPVQVYETTLLGKRPLPRLRDPVPGTLVRFAMVRDDFFISTGRHIVKVSGAGEIDFVCDLASVFHNARVSARALEPVVFGSKETLLIAEEYQSLIHCFALQTR